MKRPHLLRPLFSRLVAFSYEVSTAYGTSFDCHACALQNALNSSVKVSGGGEVLPLVSRGVNLSMATLSVLLMICERRDPNAIPVPKAPESRGLF